jgi:hypothetical protein
MGPDERRENAAALRRLVEDQDIVYWVESQFKDLLSLTTSGGL